MVGRLVEDEELRRAHQRPRQSHALRLATRQLGHLALEEARHAEPLQDRLGLPAASDGLADGAIG